MIGRLIALVVIAFVVSGVPAEEKAKSKRLEDAAKSFVELLDKGEFAKATANFDAAMLKALPPAELKKTWEKVVEEAGAFKKQLGARQEKKDKYDIIVVTCEFAKSKIDTRVVFDKDAKITGLFFAPAKKPTPTGAEEIYEGVLKVGKVNVRLVFHLFKQKDDSYAATMDSPDEGAKGIVLDKVVVKDKAVRLELDSAKFVFEGKQSNDGKEIDGTFKQAGQSFPLLLKRVAKATESRRPQTPKKPYPHDEIEVTYESKQAGIKLAGALTLPKSKGPFPAVLLIAGSGPQDRDETILGHKPFLVLADYLTRRGIAVLRVDDRGVGGSTGKNDDSTSADFAQDVLAGVEFLKRRKEINPAHIGLIGHSEGGLIAPLAASQSKDIAFIVMMAGPGLTGEEILYIQGAAILKAAGKSAKEIARQKELDQRIYAVVRAEKDNAVAEKKIRAALAELAAKLDKDEKKQLADMMPDMKGEIEAVLTPWFRYFLTHDPRPALRKVTCPVLALNGAKDVQVDAPLNLKAIEAALKEAGNKDYTIKEFADLNHLFQKCETGAISEYSAIEETIAPVVLETIAKWIAKRMTAK